MRGHQPQHPFLWTRYIYPILATNWMEQQPCNTEKEMWTTLGHLLGWDEVPWEHEVTPEHYFPPKILQPLGPWPRGWYSGEKRRCYRCGTTTVQGKTELLSLAMDAGWLSFAIFGCLLFSSFPLNLYLGTSWKQPAAAAGFRAQGAKHGCSTFSTSPRRSSWAECTQV